MQIHLTDWLAWERRAEIADQPGVYVIAKESVGDIVYIGRTWGRNGLRDRLRQFHRSATTGIKGHAGGVTYHGVVGGEVDGLKVRVHVPVAINPSEDVLRPYIEYAERRLIWEFVERVGRLPLCNSE